MYYSYYTIGGELYHHGIQGQKWGVRNGPPYPLNKDYKVINRKQSIWRNGTKNSKFMNRKYTYTNVCDDLHDHLIQTMDGFEGGHQVIYEMKPRKELKIAKLEEVASEVSKLTGKKMTDSISFLINFRGDNNSYIDGMFGNSKSFDLLVSNLNKLGYDGMEDPIDGVREARDNEPIISTVIFNPKKNLKIVRVNSL